MKRIVFIVMCLLITLNTFGQKKKTTKKAIKSYTVEQALEYVDDYFSFYEADTAYDNPEARKISNNVFHIRVDVCKHGNCYKTKTEWSNNDIRTVSTGEKDSFWWESKLYVLTIGTGGKYSMKEKFNY
jgi:hypothetical protein